MKKLLFVSIVSLSAFSCVSPTVNGGINVRYEQVGNVIKNCSSLENKLVTVKGVYKGWNCSENCKHPDLTRSDTCIVDSSGCIYLKGTGGLDPIMDRGKEVFFRAVVKKSPNGVCYLEVKSIDEIR